MYSFEKLEISHEKSGFYSMSQSYSTTLTTAQRMVTVLSLVVTLASSHVPMVQAADASSAALFLGTDRTAAHDDHNTAVDFVISGTRITTTSGVQVRADRTNANAHILPHVTNGLIGPINEKRVVPEKKAVLKTIRMNVTAYSSTPGECDGDPFVTADGSIVRDGIVATNVFPFGTKIRLPAYFGDRVFEVHDRMNPRYSSRVDIWMSNKQDVRSWGLKQNVQIDVVEWGDGKTQWAGWTKKRLAEASHQAASRLKNIE